MNHEGAKSQRSTKKFVRISLISEPVLFKPLSRKVKKGIKIKYCLLCPSKKSLVYFVVKIVLNLKAAKDDEFINLFKSVQSESLFFNHQEHKVKNH